ncbi:MAG: ABC transporter permease [Oscillospiraceae bacterium]|nr:ABC transporter permease [Oscillospiraceae bacterium]
MSGRAKHYLGSISFPVLSILGALILGGIIITAMGYDAAFAYRNLWGGAFGNMHAFSETLIQTTPLLFTAVSYSIAYKCGLINLGAEGQLHMGAMFGAFVGARFAFLPGGLHIVFVLLCGFAGGALWGFIVGALRMRFGASELITTIMLNYVALELLSFAVTNQPFRDMTPGAAPRMNVVIESVRLPILLPQTRLHLGLFFALLAIVVYYIFMWKTTKGYEMRVAGLNPNAGRYAGMNIGTNGVLAITLAGGVAGLGGIVNVIGLQPFLTEGFSNNFGFSGIAVALLGGCHPIGILVSGIFFGALNAGGIRMQLMAQVPAAAIMIIQGMIIVFAVSRELFIYFGLAGKSIFKRSQKAGGARDA